MDDKKEILLAGRLDGKQRNRLKRLLDMFYTPKELSMEVGFNLDQVYKVYIPLGCPNERDIKNHILINGKLFSDWYKRLYAKQEISIDETFCRTCRKAVKIVNPIPKQAGELSYVLSNCPNCGRKLTRITNCSRGKRD